jgi:hypothetical protein
MTKAPRSYVVVAPSPCVEYRHIYTDALYSARQIARRFRRQDRECQGLKRFRRPWQRRLALSRSSLPAAAECGYPGRSTLPPYRR